MNENIKKWISIFMAIIIVFCILYSCGKTVHAEVPSTQVVQKHTSIWTGYSFQYNGDGNYYTIEDATGIPDGTILNPYYFVTNGDGVFYALPGIKAFTTILNKGIGLIIDPDIIDSLYTGFFTALNITDGVEHKYIQKGLYDSNDNFLGYCLNDISGCYWIENTNNQEQIPFNGTEVNNVNNYYQSQNNSIPDFFTYYPFNNTSIYTNWHPNYTWTQTEKDYFINEVENLSVCYVDIFSYYQRNHLMSTSTSQIIFDGYENVAYAVCDNISNWNSFCTFYDVSLNSLLATDMVDTTPNGSIMQLALWLYDSNDTRITSGTQVNVRTQQTSTINNGVVGIGHNYNNIYLPFSKEFTVYKNAQIKDDLDTKTYQPTNYPTDTYVNYDSNNDNSFTATIYQIDNSTSYNDSSYNNISENYYDYYDNGYVDNSSIVNNSTTTINNYYSSEPTPDNPDNPDNPDDNQTLDEILRAILRFFNAIGDIIGTLLASIINLIDSVLEALAGVMEDLTGASDLFASVFAWIPEPVPKILGAGFGICLVCGIIKFIRG